jgi:hypothetical protein
MFGTGTIIANAKAYRKTPMSSILDRHHIDSLRPFMKLPPTVQDAKPMIMMFIEHNPQLQHASPETVINNIVQFAIAFQQVSGRQVNLTMEQDEAIPMPPPKEEEEKAEKKLVKVEKPVPEKKPVKKSPKIEELDPEIEAELEKQRKKLLMAKQIAMKKAELRKLQEEEDVPESE